VLRINVWPVGDRLVWRPLEVSARGKGPARPTQRPALRLAQRVGEAAVRLHQNVTAPKLMPLRIGQHRACLPAVTLINIAFTYRETLLVKANGLQIWTQIRYLVADDIFPYNFPPNAKSTLPPAKCRVHTATRKYTKLVCVNIRPSTIT
jgi:hypothetical protein